MKTSRRNWFKAALASTAAAGVGAAAGEATLPDDSAKGYTFTNGVAYKFHWTGWKGHPAIVGGLSGQWIARRADGQPVRVPKDGPNNPWRPYGITTDGLYREGDGVYSSFPGDVDLFCGNYWSADLTPCEDQKEILDNSGWSENEQTKAKAKALAFHKLFIFLQELNK